MEKVLNEKRAAKLKAQMEEQQKIDAETVVKTEVRKTSIDLNVKQSGTAGNLTLV